MLTTSFANIVLESKVYQLFQFSDKDVTNECREQVAHAFMILHKMDSVYSRESAIFQSEDFYYSLECLID